MVNEFSYAIENNDVNEFVSVNDTNNEFVSFETNEPEIINIIKEPLILRSTRIAISDTPTITNVLRDGDILLGTAAYGVIVNEINVENINLSVPHIPTHQAVINYVMDKLSHLEEVLPIAKTNVVGGVISSKAQNGVTVDGLTGTMTVNSLNVNKLFQTDNEKLILYCGDSEVL